MSDIPCQGEVGHIHGRPCYYFVEALCIESGEQVSEVEYTYGNYDDNGKLVPGGILTFTTRLCEVGIHKNKFYFVYIINSDSFSEDLFLKLKKISGLVIYGFKNFKKNYYPSDKSDFTLVKEKISMEDKFQIQCNFDSKTLSLEKVWGQYCKMRRILINCKASVLNQL